MADNLSSTKLTARTIIDQLHADGRKAQVLEIGPGTATAWIVEHAGREFVAIATDPAFDRGAIGLTEAAQIHSALTLARTRALPVVFLMDSSGIRVSEGVAGIAALRRLVRLVTDLRLDGTKLLSVNLGNIFGGMSVIAALCDTTLVHDDTVLAVSGPRLIAAADPLCKFDAGDAQQVRDLIGGRARTQQSSRLRSIEPDSAAIAEEIRIWLNHGPDIPTPTTVGRSVEELAGRLTSNVRDETTHPTFSARPGTLRFETTNPTGSSASDCVDLIRFILGVQISKLRSNGLTVVLNAPGHSSAPQDEAVHLGEYLADLALTVALSVRGGIPVYLEIRENGGGAIQGALGGPATSVAMHPGARLHVLSPAALVALRKGSAPVEPATFHDALVSGAADFQTAYVEL